MENNFKVLTQSSEFYKIKTYGRRVYPAPWIVFNYLKNDQGSLRFGWTISKKIGSAVVRNKLKRWLREYFRAYVKTNPLNSGVDINVVLRPIDQEFYQNMDHSEFDKSLEKGLKLIFNPT